MIYTQKKILVISHNAFSNITNNGKTLESILNGVQPNNRSQLFFLQESPDFSFCQQYFNITDKDMLYSLFSRKLPGREIKCTTNADLLINNKQIEDLNLKKELNSKKRSFIYRFASHIAHRCPQLRDLYWLKKKSCNTLLMEWGRHINPDVIFFVAGNCKFSHEIAVFLSGYLKIPLISFFTDDYLFLHNSTCQNRRLLNSYRHTIDKSSALFACCDYMSDEYSNFFSRTFHTLLNTLNIREYVEYKQLTSKVIISYFGGLHLNRDKMILRLAKIINGRCEINVYSNSLVSEKLKDMFNESKINLKVCLTGEELWKTMLSSDILLHVESDNKHLRKYTRLSLSTKLPEYMMTGRCILAYGPKEVSSLRIISDNDIGCVLSSDGVNDSEANLNKIIEDFDYRKRLGLNSYIYAVKKLNREIISDNFIKIIEGL